jgi:hypothetical protein
MDDEVVHEDAEDTVGLVVCDIGGDAGSTLRDSTGVTTVLLILVVVILGEEEDGADGSCPHMAHDAIDKLPLG